MFSKILIANRGEIACRIIRTCNRLGIKTVAVYSEPDKHAIHVSMADEKIALDGSEAKDTYLSIDKIVAACKKTKAEAVHPGYGFLSENATFAKALAKAKITFIGPRPETIELMGDKVKAKEFATKCKVPLVPGIESEKELPQFIKKNGFPILIKAAAGGGGRGMRKVYSQKELAEALSGAKREAEAFFNDGRVFIEKLIENGRHIEVQVFGDTSGDAIHLFDRDCTTQRRHQKVIEEAPSTFIPENIRKDILSAAERLCKESGYIGAGTVEFLVAQDGTFYFLEVNSRLQVEHPVTEEILGLDLVELQINIAAGRKLTNLVDRKTLVPKGHAIEARICAESPEKGFVTSTGKILKFNADQVAHIFNARIDTGFRSGDEITHYYDSLLAKVITYGETRAEAVRKCQEALKNFHILGIQTNIPYVLRILESPEFSQSSFHINAAESLVASAETQSNTRALIASLYLLAERYRDESSQNDAWSGSIGWRQIESALNYSYKVNGETTNILLQPLARHTYRVLDAKSKEPLFHLSRISLTPQGSLSFLIDGRHHGCALYKVSARNFLATHLGTFEVEDFYPHLKTAHSANSLATNELCAPFPGKVVSIKFKKGQNVVEGASIIVLESMKMEHPIKAPLAAIIETINVKEGEVIEAGKVLARLSFA